MGAWKDKSAKALIAKNGKASGQLKIGLIEHKNKDVKAAAVENTMQRQWKPKTKFKRPEGEYEIQFGVTFKAQQKTKFHKKKPLPPNCPMDSCIEFTEIRIFVDKIIKMPEYHTLEIGVFTNIVQNAGSPKDMDPEASFQFDIKSGHMVMGKWHQITRSIHFCAGRKSKGHIY